MGGVKTWDLYQEYPEKFAALAPMGATVVPGRNSQFSTSPVLNDSVIVPVFYSGGQSSQLRELPFQGQDCIDRINYLFGVNRVDKPFDLSMSNRSEWEDTVYGFKGDIVREFTDETHPESLTTVR